MIWSAERVSATVAPAGDPRAPRVRGSKSYTGAGNKSLSISHTDTAKLFIFIFSAPLMPPPDVPLMPEVMPPPDVPLMRIHFRHRRSSSLFSLLLLQ